MKTLLTIALLSLLTKSSNAQKYFESKLDPDYGFEILIPSFEHQKFDRTEKSLDIYMFTDAIYFKTFFNQALESVLPKDSINRLLTFSGRSTRSMATIIVDPEGKIWDITFSVPVEDRKILTDELLYSLHQKISEIKVDMRKIRMDRRNAVPIKDTYGRHSSSLYGWPEREKKK